MIVKLRAKHFINKSQVEKITHGLDKSQAKIDQLCVFNSRQFLKKIFYALVYSLFWLKYVCSLMYKEYSFHFI